jgi:hypothetical protein
MTHITMREATRLLLVAFGLLCTLAALISSLSLLCARAERGEIRIYSTFARGEPTNVVDVVWGSGVHSRLEHGDLPAPPKAGGSVAVLAVGKAGTLKWGRSFWRVWMWAGASAATGAALIVSGLYITRRQPSSPARPGYTRT